MLVTSRIETKAATTKVGCCYDKRLCSVQSAVRRPDYYSVAELRYLYGVDLIKEPYSTI